MLEINFPAVCVTIVVFLTMIYFLNSKLYKPLLAFMDERENSIKRDEESVKQNSNDVSADKIEIENTILKARDEAAKIRATAIEKAKAEAGDIIAAKKAELESDFGGFMKELNDEKENLKKNLIQNLPDFKGSLKNTLSKI